MGVLEQLTDNEFSVEVIGVMNYRLDEISTLVSDNMDVGVYEEIEDKLSTLLVDISKEFFTQGFIRGIAATKGGAV